MSDAYYDKEKAKAGYILMNLILPFIICGLIAFIVKILVMPSYTIDKVIRKIQNNENLRNSLIENDQNIVKKKKHDIKNKKSFDFEKSLLEREFISIYSFYAKKVIIYFIVGLIVLTWNWYMMTSFCAIFRNSGHKLIANSLISLLASFIHPLILGLIPSGIAYLSIKTKKESIYRVYKIINFIL